MTLIPGSLEYTDKDFDALRLRLQNLVRSVFPAWTDYNVSNFGNILLEMFAFVGDVTCFYQDNQSAESRISTATQRKNLIALAKLLGFSAATATAATATETFTLGAVPAGNVILPAGTKVRTPEVTESIAFQLQTTVTIPAGTDPPTASAVVENSEAFSDTFIATERANQECVLTRTPYLDSSAAVAAGNGSYTQVVNFLDSVPSSRHYTIVVDQNDQATIRFGNGVNGAVPTGNITAVYKVGGGIGGNVLANTITKIEGSFTDSLGNPVSIACTNAATASGGANRMSGEQIRQLAPETVRVAARTVSREDYEINARRVPEVARALMLTSNEYGVVENTGLLFVIPQGGGVPSQAIKDDVLTMVTETYPNTVTFLVEVMDPLYLTINVQATVYLRQGYSEATVKANIETALEEFFQISNADGTPNTNVDFGFNYKDEDGESDPYIAWSDVFNCVRDAVGVRKVDDSPSGFLLNGERSDVAIPVHQFPTLGTVTIYNGATGSVL